MGAVFHFEGAAAASESITATVRITVCGNDIKEAEEECDGSDLNGQSCSTQGFDSGTLACSAACEFDTSSCTTDTGGGQGGGGGGIALFPTSVSFSGWAYANQTVTLLKGAQAVRTTTAGPDGTFTIALTGLSAGSYVFALYGEDAQGRTSNLFALPLRIAGAVITNVSNIIIAPTIDSDKSQVRQGDSIVLFGQSAPRADITIDIEGERQLSFQTVSDKNGTYLYDLDTALLEQGSYQARARVSLGDRNVSGLSAPVHFLVGTQSVIKGDIPRLLPFGDLNQDSRINLVDFSILIYWIGRPNPPATVDMDGNGIVNLKDFSIMSYYWTG